MKQKMGQSPARQSLTKYTDVLRFGKYKGKTVRQVMFGNPSYLMYIANREIVILGNKIRIETQSLLDREAHNKSRSYRTSGHNYSSYYDDDPGDPVWGYFDPH